MSETRKPNFNLYILPASDAPEDTKWRYAGPGWRNRDGSVNVIATQPIPEGARLQVRLRKSAG